MKNRDILRQVLRVLTGEVVCIALMLGVYALLGKFTVTVVLSALVGGIIAIGNFFLLAISVAHAIQRAARDGEPAKAKLSIQYGTMGRLAVLLVLYIVLLKSGRVDPIAALLPLIFAQISIRTTEFFRKDGEN